MDLLDDLEEVAFCGALLEPVAVVGLSQAPPEVPFVAFAQLPEQQTLAFGTITPPESKLTVSPVSPTANGLQKRRRGRPSKKDKEAEAAAQAGSSSHDDNEYRSNTNSSEEKVNLRKRRNNSEDEDADFEVVDVKLEPKVESDGSTSPGAIPNHGELTRRGLDEDEDWGESITLSRDLLLTISSADFERFVLRQSQRRALTEADQKEIRRQRRLIKNRESAALSRNRKKQALETLEVENARLRAELERERQQRTLFQTFLDRTGQLKMALSQSTVGYRPALGNTGVLLAVFFSIALLVVVPGFLADRRRANSGASHLANLRKLMSVDGTFSAATTTSVRKTAEAAAAAATSMQHKNHVDRTPSGALSECNATKASVATAA